MRKTALIPFSGRAGMNDTAAGVPAARSLIATAAVLVVLLTSSLAYADDFIGLTYDMAVPGGKLGDYLGEASWRGFTFEGRRGFGEMWSVGVSLNYNVFHETTDEMIALESQDISGTQFRVVYCLPLLATAHYYFNWDYYQAVEPYVGIGVGGYRIERRLDIGVYSITDKNWHFGLAPEAGLVVPFDFQTSFYFNVKYNYALGTAGIGPYSYWGFNIGMAWRQ